MNDMNYSLRGWVLEHCRDRYGTVPDNPWEKYPDNTVLRHGNNKKWFGIIMNVPLKLLDSGRDGAADVLNVKCDPEIGYSLVQTPGIYPAYHMNKRQWLSLLLDGSVEKDEISALIEMSYDLTGNKRKRNSTGR